MSELSWTIIHTSGDVFILGMIWALALLIIITVIEEIIEWWRVSDDEGWPYNIPNAHVQEHTCKACGCTYLSIQTGAKTDDD